MSKMRVNVSPRTQLAHKIQLDPTVKQSRYLAMAAGTARFVWNHGLAEWDRQYKAGLKPNGAKLKKEFNKVKYERFPWLEEIHRDAHAQPFANLQTAFVRFFKGKARRPKFKKKGRRDSFYVANDKIRFDDFRARLPVIGWVKTTENLRLKGKVMGASVSREGGRWFLSVRVKGNFARQRKGDGVVGVDLGVKTAIVPSQGQPESAPKPLKKSLKKLARLSRQLSRRKPGSQGRAGAKAQISRLHWHVAQIRKDWLHKITDRLCRENQTVVIEDLNVKGMMANHKLARAISDVGFYEFRRQLEYKAKLYGTEVVVAPRFFPSSKMCSGCGTVKKELTLAERVFHCDQCGLTLDRDLNAARNLRTLGLRGIDARGQDGNVSSVKPDQTTSLEEAGTKPCAHKSAQFR